MTQTLELGDDFPDATFEDTPIHTSVTRIIGISGRSMNFISSQGQYD